MLAAAREQHLPHDRLSFVDALRWLAVACEHRTELELLVNPLRLAASNLASRSADPNNTASCDNHDASFVNNLPRKNFQLKLMPFGTGVIVLQRAPSR